MAPTLKILMIYFSFLSEVPASKPPPGSPIGSLWREIPVYRTFCVSQKPHLSGSPVKETSLKFPFMKSLAERGPTKRALFHSSIKIPGIQLPPPYQVPLGWEGAPMERNACFRGLS
jgi:hypothetical protein